MDTFESDLVSDLVSDLGSCFLRGESLGMAYEGISGGSGDWTPPPPFSTPAAVSSGFNRRP
eukprot:scaffold50373_cov70-Phaeocystis_antarctica.AAC.3